MDNNEGGELFHSDDGGGRERVTRVNYPGNSKKAKEEQKGAERPKPEKIAEATKRQRSLFGNAAREFINEDSPTVFRYIVMEVLVPAAKSMISDAISQGIDRVLYGGEPRHTRAARPGYTNYSRTSTGTTGRVYSDPRPPLSRQARATHDFANIVIPTRGEAEDVLDRLRDLIEEYEVATVSDLYDLVGLTGEFTDDKWGWTDLRTATIRTIRGGFILNLPRTQPIL